MLKLLPNYIERRQRNLDLRADANEEIEFSPARYKTGKDYFTETFYTLFVILCSTLLFYR